MAFVDTKAKFHIALNGVGYLLQGSPDRPAYKQDQAPVYGNRFAQGDRSYDDFSFWWFMAQTDWSGGFKDVISWADDAKYYYSTNIDTWSEPGSMKLARAQTLDEDFAETITCGVTAEVAGSTYNFIGTQDGSDSRPHVYQANQGTGNTWTDISTTSIVTGMNAISQMFSRNGILWVLALGLGSTDNVNSWDGSTWRDNTDDIITDASLSTSPQASRCGVTYLGVLYIFVDNFSSNYHALVKTTADDPEVSGSWSKVFERTGVDGVPVACAGFNGKIVYLLNFSGYMELWEYDITATTNTLLRTFKGTNASSTGLGDKLIVERAGKLIITIPSNEVWEYNGAALTRIFVKDSFKRDVLGNVGETSAYLQNGCVIADDKAWWGNLMYDGEYFFNTFQDIGDVASNIVTPMFVDAADRIWHTGTADTSRIYFIELNGLVYKGTADQNYLVSSNFDNVSGVDKLAFSVSLGFKKFASGQSIVVEYTTDELGPSTSWTTLGTASHTLDGASTTQRTFNFPVGTIFRKIWFRVKLAGGGSDTPTLTDFVMQYLPMPAQRKKWDVNINCGDELKSLDGALTEIPGRQARAKLEAAWWTKSVLDFQDLDYATTLLNGSISASTTTITVDTGGTTDFPEAGRIRIDDEEIIYTGKNQTEFTGCIRGARDTKAVAHADNAVVNNGYKVIITDLGAAVPLVLEDKELEYVVGISLREV